jgi:hypothetical protein
VITLVSISFSLGGNVGNLGLVHHGGDSKTAKDSYEQAEDKPEHELASLHLGCFDAQFRIALMRASRAASLQSILWQASQTNTTPIPFVVFCSQYKHGASGILSDIGHLLL